MAFVTKAVTVGTTPTLLASALLSADNIAGSTIAVYVNGATAIELVGDTATAFGSGIPVASGSYYTQELLQGSSLYALTASGTSDVRVGADG